MLSYPKPHERGKFLGIWVSMRNSGEVVGGIVSLCTNIGEHDSSAATVCVGCEAELSRHNHCRCGLGLDLHPLHVLR